MYKDLLSWFSAFPLEAQLFGAALLIASALAFSGSVYIRRHGNEESSDPQGLRGFLFESWIWSVAMSQCLLVLVLSLVIIFAPVLLFTRVFHLPYGLSAVLGLPLGIFLAAIILLGSGIAER